MRTSYALLCLLVLCLVVSGVSPCAANLLTNPGFEDGTTAWAISLRNTSTMEIVSTPGVPHSGTSCLLVTPVPTDPATWVSVAQGSYDTWTTGVSIPISSQKYYRFSAWVKVPGAATTKQPMALRFRFQPSGDRWDVGAQDVTTEDWVQLVSIPLKPKIADNLLGYLEVHSNAEGFTNGTNIATYYLDDCAVDELDPYFIAGKVTDEAGVPLEGATVTCTKLDGTVVTTATTPANGTYSLEIPPVDGSYTVSASKALYGSVEGFNDYTATLPPNPCNLADIKLQAYPLDTITGTVTSGGVIMPGVKVSAALAPSYLFGPNATTVSTGSDGKYTLQAIHGMVYYVSAQKFRYAVTTDPALLNDIFVDENKVVNIELGTMAPLVKVDAAPLTAGTFSSWTNTGSLGGQFQPIGTVSPVAGSLAQYKSAYFDNSPMVLMDSTGTSRILAPAAITGATAKYTVSAWLYDTVMPDQQTYLAWAKRGGPAGTNCEMVYGTNAVWGATGHWNDAGDMSWGNAVSPSGGVWHNVVITYDGATETAYIDGVKVNSETKALAIAPDLPIVLGSGYSYDDDPAVGTIHPDVNFSGHMARLELDTSIANAEEVATLYTQGPPMLPVGTIRGKVEMADASSAAGFVVTVKDPAGTIQGSMTTGDDGTYSLVVAAPGTYTVSAIKFNYVTMPAPQTAALAAAGDTVDLDDFTATFSTITGILKDAATGLPVYNGVVQTGGISGDVRTAIVTDATGAFTLPGTGCGGIEIYGDAINYHCANWLVASTGSVTKDVAISAEPEPLGLNGNMEDLVGTNPSQWPLCPWGTAGSIAWSASTTAKTGLQSLFYTTTASPVEYDGLVKIVQLTPGYCYNFYYSAKADPEVFRWQPMVEFMDATGGHWDGFVSNEELPHREWAHDPYYDWHVDFNWMDRSNTRAGVPVRWTPLPGQTEVHFIFLFEGDDRNNINGNSTRLPIPGKGCYIDDLVLDAVAINEPLVVIAPEYTPVANLAELKALAGTGKTVKLTGSVTVTCKNTGVFFVGEESYKGCIKVVGNDAVTAGSFVKDLTGIVTVDGNGQYTITLSAPVAAATGGNAIKVVGANNKAAKTDAKLRTNLVKVWGNVVGSTIDDGYGSPITVINPALGTGVVSVTGVLWQEGGSVVLYQNL